MGNTVKLNLPYPELTDPANVPADIRELAQAIDPLGMVPIGAMMIWALTAAPGGWMLCQGQTDVLASAYPELASVLGTQVISGVTVVKIPDLTGRIPLGVGAAQSPAVQGGTAHTLLEKGGEQKHIIVPGESAVRNHTHSGNTGPEDHSLAHTHGFSGFVPGRNGGQPWASYTAPNGGGGPLGSVGAPFSFGAAGYFDVTGTTPGGAAAHVHGFGTSNPDGGQANGAQHENMPPYLAVNFIVRHGH
jgi:microcystin-dependent protein